MSQIFLAILLIGSSLLYKSGWSAESVDPKEELVFTLARSVHASDSNMKNFFAFNFENKNRYLTHLRYSQPNTFFRWPGSRNILAGIYVGHNTHKWSVPVGISQSLHLFKYRNFFFDFELGIVYSTIRTTRINSRFCFTWAIETGIHMNGYKIALAKRHYSNGDLSKPNDGENFVGLSFGIDI